MVVYMAICCIAVNYWYYVSRIYSCKNSEEENIIDVVEM